MRSSGDELEREGTELKGKGEKQGDRRVARESGGGGGGGERDAVMSQEQGQKGLSNHPCHMPVMSWMVGPY